MPTVPRVAVVGLLFTLVACQGPTDTGATPTPTATPTATTTTAATPTPTVDPVDAMADATSCAELAVLVVDGLQLHIDAYATAAPQQVARFSTELRPDLERLATTAGRTATELGCTGQEYRDLLAAELERLRRGTGVQRAVAGTFVSGLLGGDDPSDPGASTFEVATAAELQAAVAEAGTGSTIRLAAGDFAIEQSLVLLRGVDLVGAGVDETTITSGAGGAAIIVGTSDAVGLQDLTVANEASNASVVAVTRGGLDLAHVALVGGRRDTEGAGGFGLVLAPDTTLERGTHRAADTTFRDNDGGGILIDGPITPSLQRVEVDATTGCGVCWIGESSGRLANAEVTGGDAALRVEGTASPTITNLEASEATIGAIIIGSSTPRIRNSEFTEAASGIEVGGDAAPVLRRVRLPDNDDVGLRLAGTSTASVVDITISGSSAGGIGVLDEAAPTITGGSVAIDGEVGVLFGGTATGILDGLTVRDARIGIQVGEEAAPTLRAIVATALTDAAILVVEQGGGTIESAQCDDDETGIVGLQTEGDMTIGDDVDCQVVSGG